MIKEKITENYEKMSKTQKKIADYILNNITASSYYSIQQLAEQAHASEASILRFCTFLGYKGYPDFKRQLQETAKEQIGIRERLEISYQAYGEKEAGIAEIFGQDIERIKDTLENLDMDVFFKTCQEIILARNIYILASRSAASIGRFFHYYLNMTLGNVRLIENMDQSADSLCDIKPDDVVIGLTFRRYSRATADMYAFAHEKGAVTIGITDSPVSPIVKNSKYYFLTDTSMPTYLDSFVAPLALINAILTEIGRNRNIELERRLSELDEFDKKFDIFE